MNHSWKTGVGTAGIALLALTACGADSETEPQPTVTETVTAEPEQSADLGNTQTEWMLGALEATSDVKALRDILVAGGLECPETEPEESSLGGDSWYLYCDVTQSTTLWNLSTPHSDRPAEETFELDGDRGLVHTEWFAVTSDDPAQLDTAEEVLDPLGTSRIDIGDS